jgi:Zn-dependent oligopeptidase
MHEGGHAAHFANIVQGSPVFAQERAPFSVALAETQSMFLDALCEDAAWQARYAKDRNGKVIPWELIERNIREKQPYKVLALRGMIAVPYFEKALYELPEDQLTTENICRIADEVEQKIQGGFSGRPLMSVPHILADESSCYYHGYVFAEMAVHQTREHFFRTEGYIVDNPNIGPKLAEEYWRAGSGKPGFLGLVNNLTGKPLSHDAWVKELGESVEDVVESERRAYEKAVAEGAAGGDVDLDMRMLFVHGDEVIADSAENGQGFLKACETFKSWIHAKWPKTATA